MPAGTWRGPDAYRRGGPAEQLGHTQPHLRPVSRVENLAGTELRTQSKPEIIHSLQASVLLQKQMRISARTYEVDVRFGGSSGLAGG